MRGARPKLDVRALDAAAGEAGGVDEGPEPDLVRSAAEQVEAEFGDDPVLSHQRYDVGQGADGRNLQECRQPAVASVGGAEGLHQLERHAHSGEVLLGVAAIVPLRVHDGQRRRQRRPGLVVVGDDQIEAELAGPGGRLVAADPAVHRDHQAGALGVQAVDRGRLQPVPVPEPLGDEVADVAAEQLDRAAEDDGGGDAVHVVVAVDGHALPRGDRLLNPMQCLGESGQAHRIVEVIEGRPEKPAGGVRIGEAAGRQQAGDHRIQPEGRGEAIGRCRIRRRVLPDRRHHDQLEASSVKSCPRRPICLNFRYRVSMRSP